MRRRDFITMLGTSAAWPLNVHAQQPVKVWRIGFLAGGSRPVPLNSNPYGAFPRGMRELGYVEGRDFIIEWRFAEGRYDLFPDLATELVQLKVDMFVLGTPVAVRPVQLVTQTIPIVMATSTDPVGNGYVASLAHPGGNTTGLASSQDDIVPKQLELLAMLVPGISRVGFLMNPASSFHGIVLKIAQEAAKKAGIVLVTAEMRNAEDLASAFAMLTNERVSESCPRAILSSFHSDTGSQKLR